MAWFGRLPVVGGFDPLFGAMSPMCCKYFSTKCSWLVSSLGRCRNASGRLTFGTLRSTGYRVANIQGHFFLMHRLVAFAFLEFPAEEPLAWYVHHRDGDASNNRVDNLMYLTQSRNVQLSYDQNPERGRAGKAVSVPIMWRIRDQTTGWNTCPSISAAAEELGVSPSAITRHCRQGTPIYRYEVMFAGPAEPEVLENEEWLPMKNPKTGLDVPGRQVSSCGRMKSSNGVITRGHQTKSGYVRAILKDHNDQHIPVYIHSLVAYNFFGAPPSSQHTQINHKDLNPGNNHVDNLEYVTPSENMEHFHANRGFQVSKPGLQMPALGRPTWWEWRWMGLVQVDGRCCQGPWNVWAKYLSMREGCVQTCWCLRVPPRRVRWTASTSRWRVATCGSGGFVKREGKTDEMNQIKPLQLMIFLALVAYTFLGPAANPTKKSGHQELNRCNTFDGNLEWLQYHCQHFHESGGFARLATGAIVMPHLADSVHEAAPIECSHQSSFHWFFCAAWSLEANQTHPGMRGLWVVQQAIAMTEAKLCDLCSLLWFSEIGYGYWMVLVC